MASNFTDELSEKYSSLVTSFRHYTYCLKSHDTLLILNVYNDDVVHNNKLTLEDDMEIYFALPSFI